MKKLIRAIGSGGFLAADGKWVPEILRAWEFPTVAEAVRAARQLHTESVELYYSFEDEYHKRDWDFPLQLGFERNLLAKSGHTQPAKRGAW